MSHKDALKANSKFDGGAQMKYEKAINECPTVVRCYPTFFGIDGRGSSGELERTNKYSGVCKSEVV